MSPSGSKAAPLTLAVCLKPTWRTDVPLRLASDANTAPDDGLRADGAKPILSALDAGVLARALALRGELAAAGSPPHLLAVSIGGSEAENVLRSALAVGADEVLRIGADHADDGQGASDHAPTQLDGSAGRTRAKALAMADLLHSRAQAGPLLVLAGDASSDEGHSVFGAFVALALGLPLAHRVARFESNPEGWTAWVKLERGYTQELHLTRSSVVTLAASGLSLPDASWPAWLASRTAAIPAIHADSSASTGSASATPAPTTTLRAPVPRVKHYTVPAANLSAEERIRALVGTQAQGGGTLIPASEGTERQVDAVLTLLQQRGYLPSGR